MTNETYAVGEVCEIYSDKRAAWVEATVVSPAEHGTYEDCGQIYTGVKYPIELDGKTINNGKRIVGIPPKMRKKRPPRDDLKIVRWADCPWQPEGIKA